MIGTEHFHTWSPTKKTAKELCRALDAHLTSAGVEPEEYGFSGRVYAAGPDDLPDRRWLVAFAVEGTNEGYYVHVGAVQPRPACGLGADDPPAFYYDLGFCKTYSPDSAYAICREVQRFLSCAEWNQ
jgi:hypothetical protein